MLSIIVMLMGTTDIQGVCHSIPEGPHPLKVLPFMQKGLLDADGSCSDAVMFSQLHDLCCCKCCHSRAGVSQILTAAAEMLS